MKTHASINGVPVPTFFYGTAWKEDDTQRCVREALRSGFRAIDTANQRKHYFEVGVGEALKEAYAAGVVTRADLFLQTKFTHMAGQDQRLPYDPHADMRTQVFQSYESSLQHLGADYIDSYVLHGPSLRNTLSDDDWEVWHAMEDLAISKKVKLIGASNVSLNQIQLIWEKSKVKPSFVQNRCFARTGWDKEVRDFCLKNSIWYQGFSLLTANVDILRDVRFQKCIHKYKCSPAQLIFAFSLTVGMIPITGTTDPKHIQEDLQAYEFELTSDDISIIEELYHS